MGGNRAALADKADHRIDQYLLDHETSERLFAHNVRVLIAQGATWRDLLVELSRGEPVAAIAGRVEEVVRVLGLKVGSSDS